MKPLAALLSAALALSTPALAAAPTPTDLSTRAAGRGWLSGLGVGLVGAGLASAVLGVGSLLTAQQANAMLSAYLPTPTSAPAADEVYAVSELESRRDAALALGLPTLIAGAVVVAGGVLCLALDAHSAVQVAVAPSPRGGVLVLSGRW